MNLTDKLKSIRQAKKRRVALMYHQRNIGGIDVPDDIFEDVMRFTKALFKKLKETKYAIEVTHWGEVFFIEPTKDVYIQYSVNLGLKHDLVESLKNRLKHTPYIVDTTEPSCLLSFQALRPGTKLWQFNFEDLANKDNGVEYVFERIIDAVAGLQQHVRRTIRIDPLEISNADIRCIEHYSAAKFGNRNQLHKLLRTQAFSIFSELNKLCSDHRRGYE